MKEKNKKNKVKGLIQLIIIAIIILLFLVFCGKNEGFTVTFNIDGKEYHEISDIKQGNTIEEPKDPEKEGYSFAGWFLNDKEFNFDKPINKNIKLDAKWNINEYTVTINTGTGSIINERVNYNGTIDKPVAPSKEGYIFVGWYSNDEIFDFNTKVNSDLNIEARWSNQIYSTYKVEHYLMNKNGKYIDTPEETQTLTGKIGSVVTPSTKEYKGYTTPEIQEITVSADGKATVRYYYSINKYKLTLKGDDGVKSITGDGEYFYNDKVDINYIIKDGYSLVNISEKLKDNAYTMEDKDVVIEITTEQNKDTKYVVKHYKMNIKGKYSTTASETEELYGVTDTSVTPSVKTYVGFTSPETTTVNVDGDGKTVVKYYYERNKYELTLGKDKGIESLIGAGKYYFEQEVNIKANIKDGYTFKAWSNDQKDTEFVYKIPAQNTSINASTTVNIYTIFYNLNNGEATNVSKYTVEDEIVLNDATKTGYTFTGWTGDKVVNGKVVQGTTGDLEITANFIANTYKIILDKNSGEGQDQIVQTAYDKTTILPLNTYTKLGYTFIGWSTEKDNTVEYSNEADVTNISTGSDVTLYAVWQINTYTITYNLNNGIATNTSTYTVEEEITLNDATKTGYTFTGWTGDKVVNGVISKGTTGDLEITANYKVIIYNITYNLDNGIATNVGTYTVEDEIILNDATKTGYTFTGWTGDKVVNGVISKGTIGDLEITANYIANEYLITYDANGGNVTPGNKTVIYDSVYGELATPTREGYTFEGWYLGDTKVTNTTEVKTAEAHTLVAKWTANEYLVTYDANGGTVALGSKTVTYDGAYGELATPTREGYTFEGWYLGDTKVTSTIEVKTAEAHTLVANWIANEYLVTYDANGGTVATGSKTVIYDSTYGELATPTREGYTFEGWYLGSVEVSSATEVKTAENHTLIANWTANEYLVTYDANGGTVTPGSKTVAYDSEYGELATPVKTGYTFEGWYLGAVQVTSATQVTTANAHTLVARWIANTYRITLDKNSGEGQDQIVQTAYYKNTTLPLNIYTKLGYTFIGWSTEKDNTVEYFDQADVTNISTGEDVTLYAVWQINTYTIMYNLNNGIATNVGTYTVEDEITLNDATKTGYTFVGWIGDKVVNGVIPKGTTGDLEITANYEVIIYNITYNLDNGEATNVKNYTVEDEITLNDATKTGYTFTGWTGDGVVNGVISKGTIGDLEITANYIANEYLVTYDANGGTVTPENKTVTYDSVYGELAIPERTGYTFEGWYLGNVEITSTTQVTTAETHTLVAKWSANQYLVTYDTNGGTVISGNKTVTYDGAYGELATPTREGYTFEGWYLGTDQVTSATEVKTAETHTLIAKWKINKYTVIFNSNGGTSIESIEVYYNGVINRPVEDPIRIGHTFVGWYLEGTEFDFSSLMPANNITLKAKWNVNSSTIGFDTNGGSIVDAIIQDYGTSVSAPQDPTRDGYTFRGWYSDEDLNEEYEFTTMPAEGITVYAKWTANQYLVTYDANGGTVTPGNKTVIYDSEYGELAIPERTGYTFEGWYLGNAKVTSTTQVKTAENHTLIAKWQINTYNITYNLDNGIATNVSTYTVEEEITLNDATKTGYTFTGWTGDNVVNGVISKGTTGDLEITANYTANEYLVTYDANGGNVTPGNKTATYDGAYGELAIPERTGYTFEGWYLENAKVTSTTQVTTAENHTLVANWTANEYLVTYDANGGSVTSTNKTITYDSMYGELATPTREGYTFEGWYLGDTKVTSTTQVTTTENHTLVANWTANEYLVTYDANGGNVTPENKTVIYDSEYGELAIPERTGYTFEGWYLENDKVIGTTQVQTADNHTLIANWTANTYKIILDKNSGEGQDQIVQTAYDKTTILPLNIYTKSGYTFIGWSTEQNNTVEYFEQSDVTNISTGSDVTLYAVWQINTYNITYNLNNGIATNVGTYTVEEEITLNDATKTGYTFTGWTGDKVVNGVILKGTTGDLEITANFTANSYKIILKSNNGSEQTQVVQTAYDKTTILPANIFTKAGYSFAGWSTTSDGIAQYDNEANVTNISEGNDVELYAIWKANTYEIKYNANGGNGTMSSTSATYDKEVQLSSNTYTRTGYSFAGWSTSKDNTVEYLNNQKVTNLVDSGTTTLYAIWNLETYTITYNLDGGTIGGTNPTTYTYESNDITLIKPTREDYVFAGWSINGTLDKEGIIEKGTTGNLEIVAQWRIKPLIESVSFDLFKADENGSYENYYADGKNHSIYMGNKAFYLKLPKDSSLDIYTLSIALNTGVILNVDSEDIVDNYADITATESSGTGYTGTIDLNLDIPMLPSTMKLKSSDKGLTWKSTSTGGMKVSTVEFTGLLSKYNKRLALAEGLGITNDEYELETPRYLSNYETIGGNVFMFFGVADSTNTKMTTKKVTFVNVSNNQVNAIDPIYVPVGSQIPDVGEVRIAGYKWIGWYSDPELTKPLDFSTLVYDNLTVYGKYEKLPVEESWYYDSEGTMDDPYKLCGPQQLLSFASFVEADTNKFANKHVKLTCSADMTGVEWIPISTFRGTFDGGEYTISNLTINDSAGVYEHIGFFDTLHNATVRNLKFKNVTINSTQSSASGALTAVMDNSTVERVAVDGVTITGSDYIGGLIGQISDLTGDKLADGTEDKVSVAIVKEISVKNGSVTANGYDVGGVIGAAANTVTISDLYSDVSVRSKGSGKPADTGGILGNYWGSDAGFKMERVIFTGSVKVSSEKFIMFGNNSSGAIYGRVGTGAIDGLTPNDSFVSDSEKITLLYKSSGIGLSKSHSLARGTGKSESALKNKSNYDTTIWSNWTFDNSANSYPTLTWLVG